MPALLAVILVVMVIRHGNDYCVALCCVVLCSGCYRNLLISNGLSVGSTSTLLLLWIVS